MRKMWMVCLTLFLGSAAVFAEQGQSLFRNDLAEKAQFYYLDNGLEVVLVPNRSAPVIGSIVLVRTGLHNEMPAINGASHFLEHLLFNGTETRSQKQLYDEIDLLGAYNNAHTDWDYTSYILLTPRENFEKALDIQADMLFHSTLPLDKFEKEKGIILEEIAKDKSNPNYQAELNFRKVLFGSSVYGMPVLGAESSIRAMTRDDVRHYYRRYYVPNNMTVFVMGDFEPGEMQEIIQRYFGEIPPGNPESKAHRVNPQFGRNAHFKIKNLSRSSVYLTFPAPMFGTDDFFAMQVAAQLLEHRLTGKLMEQNPPAVLNIGVGYQAHLLASYLQISALLVPESSPDRVRAAVQEIVNEYLQQKIPLAEQAREIERVVRKILIQDIYDLQRPHYFAMLRSQEMALGGGLFIQTYTRKYQEVTPEAVQASLQKYLTVNPTVVLVTPLEAAKAESGETARKQWTRKVLFENGITVIARQDTANGVAGLHILFANRAALEPDSLRGIAEVLHYIFDKGSKALPGEKFQEKLEELGANLKVHDWGFIPYDDYYWSSSYGYVRLECLNPVIDPSLDLIAQMLMEPNINEQNLSATKRLLIGQVKRGKRSARQRAKEIFREKLYGSPFGDPILGDEKSLGKINLTDLQRFHEAYVRGENLIISIVSPNPVEKSIERIRNYFGDFPGQVRKAPLTRMVKTGTVAETIREELGGSQSYILVGKLLDDFSLGDLPALWVLNRLLSDRLAFYLREEKGWAYSIGSSVGLDPIPHFVFAMGTRPENIEDAYKEVMSELAAFKKLELTDHDILKAINQLRGQMLRRFLTRENQAYYLGLGDFLYQDYDLYFRMVDRLSGVKKDDLKRVRKKYFGKDHYLSVLVK